jgi:transcriptional regulator with XRE-family HTH domain
MTPIEIKKLRGSLGLNQFDFAEELGVQRSTIVAWEKGHKFPQPKNLEKLVELANPSKKWVFLTIEEIDEIAKIFQERNGSIKAWGLFASAIEHNIRRKNT